MDHGQVLVDHDHGLVFLFGQTSGSYVDTMAVCREIGSATIQKSKWSKLLRISFKVLYFQLLFKKFQNTVFEKKMMHLFKTKYLAKTIRLTIKIKLDSGYEIVFENFRFNLINDSMFHLLVWHLNMATPSRSEMAMAISPRTFDILLTICDFSSSIVVKVSNLKWNQGGGIHKIDNCLFTLENSQVSCEFWLRIVNF